jgi:hypothetical protein
MLIRNESDPPQDLHVNKKAGIVHSIVVIPFMIAFLFVPRTRQYHRPHRAVSVLVFGVQFSINTVLFGHVYWEGMFGRKQWISIKSFLVTGGGLAVGMHPIIWYREGSIRFHPVVRDQIIQLGIDLRAFNWSHEILGTPFACFPNGPPSRGSITKMSDWLRLLLLYRYGGLWFDCDLIFLRSPQEIIQRFGEFVTQWERQPYTNNCFMHFRQKGAVIATLLIAAARTRQPAGVWGLRELRLATLLPGITMIPNTLTEFCWIGENCDTGFIFLSYASLRPRWLKLFAECIVWHWHNRYNWMIHNTSLFAQVERRADAALGISQVTTSF